MLPRRGINLTYIDYDFNKGKWRAETAGHHYSCLYLDKEDMEFTSEDNYKVIKKEDKKLSSVEEPLSLIPVELFE